MIFDLHNDFPTNNVGDYAEYLKAVAADNIVTAVIWSSELRVGAVDAVERMRSRLERTGMPVAIEDIGFLFDDEKYKTFDFSPYFYCSLTWNNNNGFAGGAHGDGDLTDAGRIAVRRINDSGCVLDLAHLNKPSFYAALDRAERVMCSHTGFNAHPRSLDGEQIKALVARNAVIGLCAVTAFTGAKSLTELACVIDGFIQRYGDDTLALGTDFNGSEDLPDDVRGYADIERLRFELSSRGHTEATVRKVLFENAYSLYNKER